MAEANIKASLSVETVDALKKIVEIKQQLKETSELLSISEKGWQYNSVVSKDFALQIEKLNIELQDATKEFVKLSEKASKFESFKDVLTGIQGGFGAITGTLTLFGEKSEIVEKALGKVKAGLEITEGISSIGKAATAFKALGIAISSTGLTIFAAAVTGIILLLEKLKDKEDDLVRKQKEYNDVLDGGKGGFINATTTIGQLKAEFEAAGKSVDAQKTALEHFNNTVGATTKQFKTFFDAEAFLSSNTSTQAYVNAMFARAKATTAFGNAAEASFDVIKNQQALDDAVVKYRADWAGRLFKGNFDVAHASNKDLVKKLIDDGDDEFKKLQDNIDKANASILDFKNIAINSTYEADKIAFDNGWSVATKTKQTLTNVVVSKKQSLKELLDSYNKQETLALENARNLGKSEEEIYNIQRHFQELRIVALQEYYDNIKNKRSQFALDIKNQLDDDVLGYKLLETNYLSLILDEADKEIKKGIQAFKLPAEVEPLAPESDEERQRKKDAEAAAKRDARDAQVSTDVDKKQAELDDANSKEKVMPPYKKQLKLLEDFHETELSMLKEHSENKDKLEKYYSEAKRKYRKQEADYELGLTKDILSQASDLLGKNTVAGKVTAIAAATINTYLGATKALATLPPPFSYVSAALTIATGIKNIQSIINTQIPGQGSPSGSLPSSASSPIIPQMQQTNTTLNQEQLNQIGNATVRAFVLESDVSNNQEKIARLNRAARLGG